MTRDALVSLMLQMLQDTLDTHQVEDGAGAVRATEGLPLIGDDAALSSMALVSFIADVESALAEAHDLAVTLVSERAFSRSRSPFRTVGTLADYVIELAATPDEPAP